MFRAKFQERRFNRVKFTYIVCWILGLLKDVFELETSNKITVNDNYNVIMSQHRRDYL